MKKIISLIIVSIMGIGMFMTVILGYRQIGSNLISYTKENYNGFEKFDKLFDTIDSSWNETLFKKDVAMDFYGLMQKLQGKEIIEGSSISQRVMKGSDGKLYFYGNVTGETNETAMRLNAEKVTAIYQKCLTENIDFLFAIAPTKYNSKQVSLPLKCGDFFETASVFSQKLEENGVNYLNLMEMWNNQSKFYSDGFFKTDHHWTIETAFWGYQNIIKKLNDINPSKEISELYYNLDNYNVLVIKNCYLGSMGVRTGGLYVGRDDISVISPKFETDFNVWFTASGNKTTSVEKSGNFANAILTNDVGYGMYVTSDTQMIKIDNKTNSTGRKILLVKDSFSIPVIAWLATCCDELIVLDLRYAQTKTVFEYVEEYNIDTLITMYNAEILGSSNLYNFGL